MSTAVVHGHPMSTYTRSVRMAAIERGVPHEVAMPPFGTPEHARLHPYRKMPALEIDGKTVFESLAGIAWLDSLGDGPALIPTDPLARARALQWASALVDYVYDDVVGLGHLAGGEADLTEPLVAAARHLPVLDGAVEPFLCGPAPTAPDLLLYPMLAYARRIPAFVEAMAGSERLLAWYEAMDRRPSARETAA